MASKRNLSTGEEDTHSEQRPLKKRKIEKNDSESSHQPDERIMLDIYHFCHLPMISRPPNHQSECNVRQDIIRREVQLSWTPRRIKKLMKELMPSITNSDYRIKYAVQSAGFREQLFDIDLDVPLKEQGIDRSVTLEVKVTHHPRILRKLQKQNGLKHEPETNDCPLMRNGEKSCAVFGRLKNYEYSLEDLEHMERYSYCAIPPVVCRYGHRGDECKAYIRLKDGANRLDDRCHLQIYQHPPRDVPKTVQSESQQFTEGPRKYSLTSVMSQSEHKQIEMLMDEVKQNGFESDLSTKDGESIMKIVNEKMKHPQHKALGYPLNKAKMLSIVLYTGCECNWYLSEATRTGEWDKWPVFERILSGAIRRLSYREYGEYPVYCGIKGVMDFGLSDGKSKVVTLRTFTSTSWDIEQAKDYCGGKGMILGFTSEVRRFGANVSWISKFGFEKEVLFPPMKVRMKLISQGKNVQKVVVYRHKEERVF